MEKVLIFDTSLRDGEQAPSASMSGTEKLQVAKALETLGVDIIEAGFPCSSSGDFLSVKTIAEEIRKPIICGLARAVEADIETAFKALEPADKKRIHTFIGSSDIHLEHKLKISKTECINRAVKAVSFAKSLVQDVEFSPEDAGRADPEFLYELLYAVIEAGASTINIPDTVGYMTPVEFGNLIKNIKLNVKNINANNIIISVHCHEDLGMATANSLAGVINGARQVECTINGIGERAGNSALEEICMILKTRKDLNLSTNINTEKIISTSHLVSDITGFLIAKNKSIVGENAFAHESGIHQDGVLKYRETYEIIDPVSIGIKTNKLPLGRRSGKHALKNRLEELGFNLSEGSLLKAYEKFKELADKKKYIDDKDLVSILDEEKREEVAENYFSIEKLQVACGSGLPTASIELRDNKNNNINRISAIGTGPVDAIYKAIQELVQIPVELIEFTVNSVTEGIDAQGIVTVRIKHKDKILSGRGTDTDILLASAKAYLNALNRIVFIK